MRNAIFSVVFWLVAGLCTAETIYVDINGPNDPGTGSYNDPFRAIENAIDLAQNDDTVIVAPGLYIPVAATGIDFNGRAITVRSTDPNNPDVVAATIIDANGSEASPGRGFYFHSSEGPDAVLDGFTITGGYEANGGGIYCFFAGPTITNCIISNNTAASYGGGINCFSANPIISQCIITDNTAGYHGGGIYCFSAAPTIANCVITGNTTNYGGAVASSYGPITNCLIGYNTADVNGGAMYNCNTSISNCIFLSNTNHAIYESYSLDMQTVNYCLFYDNPDGDWFDSDTLSTKTGADAINALPEAGNNIDTDPLLKPDGYHLEFSSPCINAGDPFGSYHDQCDIDGQPRLLYGRVDIGADEVLSVAGDFEPDGDVDTADLAVVSDNWLQNGPGTLGDIDDDNIVNFSDFVLLAQNWMKVQKKIPDLNQDGIVNFNDLALLSSYWMEQTCLQPHWCQGSDFNKSGCVDFVDLTAFAANWLCEQP